MNLLAKTISYLGAFASGAGATALAAALVFCLPVEEDIRLMSATVSPQYLIEAANTVRPIEDVYGRRVCSAVVVAPGRAYTASHCVAGEMGVTVEGKPIVRGLIPVMSDAAVVDVPGLECPCAVIGATARVGEQLYATGYPNGGERATNGPAPVLGTGVARDVLLDLAHKLPKVPLVDHLALTYVEGQLLIGGMSGGGAFVYRDKKWVLVATNTLTLGWPGHNMIYSGFAPLSQHAAL